MKFSTSTLLTALTASTALAAPAVVTVTEHVHEDAVVTVQGFVYQHEGAWTTTYVTLNGVAQIATATSAATTSAKVAAVTTKAAAATTKAQVSAVAVANVQKASSSSKDAVQAASPTTSAKGQAVTVTAPGPHATVQQTTTIKPSVTQQYDTTPRTVTKTSTTTRPTESVNLSDFASSMLSEHNKKRELHQNTPDLTWSETLASYAQNYADNYDCSGNLVHSGGQYGENLAVGYGTTGSVDAWYNEISNYDFSNPGFSSNTGHFTQLVWKGTSQVGCGVKSCGGVWGDYVICSYNPAGNVAGQYADNVQSLK
ncbi:similar to Saccharomyces cerevisiae YJL079C PRY1 Protein of unknown function [Maudiozyma barnettii]|uniref:SCP domain-containing protein n=1 Tax=Maudiozyma barnettii TaxID=61262 RepID=A0A8H2VK73_9SACH|nr:sterol-binding protein [Kazachstania barnettii]CAB4256941.1 similar to Saccharomyces cerevisiae YJL079C PRY1 Protein of unknown function [Kazachstania barnettii]CAD1785546.1 similar to Saccharomyces cerevisiae YJL079C PRY1 Protein of unknown function [Kazachstania barnettii]